MPSRTKRRERPSLPAATGGGGPIVVCRAPREGTARHARENILMSRPGTTQGDMALAQVLASAPIILFTLDCRGIVTLSEGKGLQALGLAPGEVVGRNVFELYGDFPQIVADLPGRGGEQVSSVSRVGNVYFEVTYSPLHDAKGELTGTIGVATDVTLRQLAKDALRQAHDELEQRGRKPHLGVFRGERGAAARNSRTQARRGGIAGPEDHAEVRARQHHRRRCDRRQGFATHRTEPCRRAHPRPAGRPLAARRNKPRLWHLPLRRGDQVSRRRASLGRARGETEEFEMFVRNSLLPEGLWLSGKARAAARLHRRGPTP